MAFVLLPTALKARDALIIVASYNDVPCMISNRGGFMFCQQALWHYLPISSAFLNAIGAVMKCIGLSPVPVPRTEIVP